MVLVSRQIFTKVEPWVWWMLLYMFPRYPMSFSRATSVKSFQSVCFGNTTSTYPVPELLMRQRNREAGCNTTRVHHYFCDRISITRVSTDSIYQDNNLFVSLIDKRRSFSSVSTRSRLKRPQTLWEFKHRCQNTHKHSLSWFSISFQLSWDFSSR